MRTLRNILLTGTVSILTLASCNEKVMVEEPSAAITFMAGDKALTKALLDNDSFRTSGTQLTIKDFYTNGATSTYWIENTSVECQGTEAIWPFTNNEHYYWTKTGTHRFFGWLAKDNSTTPAQTIPADWTYFDVQHSLSVSATIPVPSVPGQANYGWDFLYAKPLVRSMDVATPDHTPVPLCLSHLYSAFAICFKDDSPSQVTFTGVKLEGLHNKAIAVINFSEDNTFQGSTSAVEWDPNNNTGVLAFENGGGVTYTVDSDVTETYQRTGNFVLQGDPFNPHYADICNNNEHFAQLDDATQNWHLMWPQSPESLQNVRLTLNYTMSVDDVLPSYAYYEPTGYASNPQRGPSTGVYVAVPGSEQRVSGGAYKVHVDTTWTLPRSKKDQTQVTVFSGTCYEYVGIGNGNCNVEFTNGTPSNTVCGYSLSGTYTYTHDKPYEVPIMLKRPEVESWEPGCKYYYLITHSENTVDLKVKVLKWEPHEENVPDFGTIYDENGDPVTGDDLNNLVDWK